MEENKAIMYKKMGKYVGVGNYRGELFSFTGKRIDSGKALELSIEPTDLTEIDMQEDEPFLIMSKIKDGCW